MKYLWRLILVLLIVLLVECIYVSVAVLTGNTSAQYSGSLTPATGARPYETLPHTYATAGDGSEATPWTSTDGTAGIGAALAAQIVRGGAVTLAGGRYDITTAPVINAPSVTLRGLAVGANIDPNGESEGINGAKLRTAGAGVTLATPSSGARLGGINVERLYIWGPGKTTYNNRGGVDITSAKLDQAHFTDLNVGNSVAAIQVDPTPGSGELDTPYITRVNALHCTFGLLFAGFGSFYAHVTDCCFSDLDQQGVLLNNSGGANHFINLTLVRCGGADGSSAYPNSAVSFASSYNELSDSRIENTGFRQLTGTAGTGGTRANYADGVMLDGSYNVVKGGSIIQTANGSGIHVRNNSVGNRIENVKFDSNLRDILIDAGCTDTVIQCPGQVLNIVDNGTRTRINGVAKNLGDPNAAGDWNGVSKPEGLVITDTTNQITYRYSSAYTAGRIQLIVAGADATLGKITTVNNLGVAVPVAGTLWASGATQTTTASAVAANVEQTACSSTGFGTRTIKPVAGSVYRLTSRGTYQTPATPGAVTVNVKLGSTILATVTVAGTVLSAASVNNALEGDVIITCRSVDGSNVGTFSIDGAMNFQTTATVFVMVPLNQNAGTVTASVASGALLDITEAWSSNAAQGTKISSTTVEQLR